MLVARARIWLRLLWWVGSRCWTSTKAKPVSAGRLPSSSRNASSPPAEAPMPTTETRSPSPAGSAPNPILWGPGPPLIVPAVASLCAYYNRTNRRHGGLWGRLLIRLLICGGLLIRPRDAAAGASPVSASQPAFAATPAPPRLTAAGEPTASYVPSGAFPFECAARLRADPAIKPTAAAATREP